MLPISSLPLIAFLVVLASSGLAAEIPSQVDFNQHVRPLLARHCLSCHGGVKQAGGLSFIQAEQLLQIVEPLVPEQSLLLERVTSDDEDYRMPPPEHGPALTSDEISLLERWIKQGAPQAKYWAYQPPKRHDPPQVSAPEWPRQPIDQFALAALEARGIRPAPDEQPTRWLRRVTLDLTGLPPTLEQRSAFLHDLETHGEAAYEAVVDRLLTSPQFGERWATVWLDQVRYADSRGQGEDSPRDIWKYRDWVIAAFNRDLPYDEFTRLQIAGDLVPGATIETRLATAMHRLTHTNEEGGTDDEEFRVAAVLDRVHTVWQTWQGVTIGCVQCHDHPYDPIRHEEYYKFMAYFNNSADCDLGDDWPLLQVPLETTEYDRASHLDQQIRTMQASWWQERYQLAHEQADWTLLRLKAVTASNGTPIDLQAKQGYDEYYTIGTISSHPTITAELPLPPDRTHLTGIRFTALPLHPSRALADAEVGFVMSKIEVSLLTPGKDKPTSIPLADAIGDEPFPYDDPLESLKEGAAGFGAYTRVHHPRQIVLLPAQPVDIAPGSTLIVRIRYSVFDLAAFSLVARRGHYAVSSDPKLTDLLNDKALAATAGKLAYLKQLRQAIPSIAIPVLQERPDHLARPSHLFLRGAYLDKGQQVQCGVPESLNEAGQTVADRLALAEWLVSSTNPLTARVAVNRYWARMFGVGLVATEEDFGSSGELPSHPQLLDDLAVRFREDYGWSVKKLLRELALSRVYRQSSRMRNDLGQPDVENRWLARGPRHRLPAEAIRDQMLALSGLLSLKAGGPPTYPPLPPGVWKARRGGWETPPVGHEDRYRRSVYTYAKRSIPFPASTTFDAPSRDVCQPRRLRSNTPLQSLMLLNDAGFAEGANAFAQLLDDQPGTLGDKLSYGFLRATCRPPRPAELDRLESLHRQVASTLGQREAMREVATLLLNLDEVLTK